MNHIKQSKTELLYVWPKYIGSNQIFLKLCVCGYVHDYVVFY